MDNARTFVQLTVTQSLLNDRIGEKKGKVMERWLPFIGTVEFSGRSAQPFTEETIKTPDPCDYKFC